MTLTARHDSIAGDVAGATDALARRLAAAGIESARLDARLLVGAATGETAAGLIARPQRRLSREEGDALSAMAARRCAREPLAQILGSREFWSLDFAVSAEVLTPRPDSETLIEAACRYFPDRSAPLRVLDLGTGSGCLLLALLHEFPAAAGLGIDLSAAAVALARANGERLGIAGRAAFAVGEWTAPVRGSFDLVVSNPPYIATADIDGLAPEVARYEPRRALDGGPDGLAAYRAILPSLRGVMTSQAVALLEMGVGQKADIFSLARECGLEILGFQADISAIPRVAILRQP